MGKNANKSQIFEKRQTNLKSAVETAGRQLTRGRPRSQTGATGGEPIHFLFVFLPFFVTLCNIFRLFFAFFGFLQMLACRSYCSSILSQLAGCQSFWGIFCLF